METEKATFTQFLVLELFDGMTIGQLRDAISALKDSRSLVIGKGGASTADGKLRIPIEPT